MSITIKIESKVPYPEGNERSKKYGGPLSEIFKPYYEKFAIIYFTNDEKEEFLEAITIHCHEPKFTYKKSEEKQFNANFYRKYSDAIISFFKNMQIKARVENVQTVSKSFEEVIGMTVDMKLKHTQNELRGIKEDHRPNIVGNNPTIVRTSKNGEEDLIVNLGVIVDPSDMSNEGMTVQETDDGKYFVGFISKKNGQRYYAKIPKDDLEKLMRNDLS